MSNQVDPEGDDGEKKGAGPKEICPSLYAALLRYPDTMLTQKDLLGLGVVPNDDPQLLLECMNALYAQHRVSTWTKPGGALVWKVVQPKDAVRYKGLNQEETIVYSYIDHAQNLGIWTAHIHRRAGMTSQAVQKIIQKLMTKKMIKQVSWARYPTRKVVMLAELDPSDEVTGGPFYSDGQLDDEFVDYLARFATSFIASRSWDYGTGTRKSHKRKAAPTVDEAEAMRAEALDRINEGKAANPWPFPPTYNGYPTARDVMKAINNSELFEARLKESDVAELLEVLCWDGRIVKVQSGKAYKSVKKAIPPEENGHNSTGLTESPCGRCPVFDWCEDGGPVNAKTCEYYAAWLEF